MLLGKEVCMPAVGTSGTAVELGALLNPRSVATRQVCSDAADALEKAASLLVRIGAVTSAYSAAVLQREQHCPTGLPTQPAGVALPHADEGVVHPAVSVLTLQQPVIFGEMGTGEPRVSVRLVVMLALPPGDAHVLAIGALAEMIQQPDFVAEALRATCPDALYATFQEWSARSSRKE
jgi:PTS system galactitol-specific IIA component